MWILNKMAANVLIFREKPAVEGENFDGRF